MFSYNSGQTDFLTILVSLREFAHRHHIFLQQLQQMQPTASASSSSTASSSSSAFPPFVRGVIRDINQLCVPLSDAISTVTIANTSNQHIFSMRKIQTLFVPDSHITPSNAQQTSFYCLTNISTPF